MAAKKTKGAVPEDLREVVREALRATGAVKISAAAGALKKALPKPYQAFAVEGQAMLLGLADQGEAHRFTKGKTSIVFAEDPIERLDRLVTAELRLQQGALPEAKIKAEIKRLAPGYEELTAEWLKSAAARRIVFLQPGKGKKYGLEPDVRGALEAVIKALHKALPGLDAAGIPRERALEVLAAELGARRETKPETKRETTSSRSASLRREQFLRALEALSHDRPRDALFSLRDLRARLDMDKQQFDDVALELSREGAVSLHHHDHPGALSESELAQLVRDARGTYYIGIALRSDS